MKNITRVVAVYFALVLGLTAAVSAQTGPDKNAFPGIKIGQFGKMDDRFYRGARPKEKEFAALKALGINTIIDLTDNTPEEKGFAEAAGLKYVNIPIKDKSYPTEEAVAQFLKTVDDPETGVFYVHCAGGRHRTGDMGALYRFAKYGWDYDKVYKEMENYDFYSSGHKKSLEFVVDYAAKFAAHNTALATTADTGIAKGQ